MTKKQFKICQMVIRYRNLYKVLRKTGIADYLKIQELLGPGVLEFSDYEMDENTEIYLSGQAIEEVETRKSRLVDVWVTRILSGVAIIISAIALLSELGILGLPRY